MKLDSYKEPIEILKNIIEILALIFAAIVGYVTFIKKDQPSFKRRTNAESVIIWSKSTNEKNCKAEYIVTFENIGVKDVNIDRVRLRCWKYSDLKLEQDEFAKYFDINLIKSNGTVFFDSTYMASLIPIDTIRRPLVRNYAPGIKWGESFPFIINQAPNNLVLFHIEFFEQGVSTAIDDAYQWDFVCGGKPIQRFGPALLDSIK